MRRRLAVILALVLSVVLTGCNGYIREWMDPGQPEVSQQDFVREITPLALPQCTGRDRSLWQSKKGTAYIEMCSLEKGYVGAACDAQVEARFYMSKDGQACNYYMEPGGEHQYFPLSMGSGTYTFRVYLHVEGTAYERVLEEVREVRLEDEKAPFLIPTSFVAYSEDSRVTSPGRKLAMNCATDLEVVQQVFYWVKKNISYDWDKAEQLRGQVLLGGPDLAPVLETGKGICFDYAVLTAAMLRANGIPCKVIIGNLKTKSGETIQHAWNMVYLEDGGEIGDGVTAQAGGWSLIDLTLAADGGYGFKQIDSMEAYLPLSAH